MPRDGKRSRLSGEQVKWCSSGGAKKEQDVRIFASSEQAMQRTWKGLFGGGVLPSALMRKDHWEFRITRKQYDTAGG